MAATKQKRILMLLGNNNYPGDKRVMREAEALVEAGFQVSVIAPRGKGERSHEVVRGVTVYRFAGPKERDSLIGYVWEFAYTTWMMLIYSVVVWLREGFDAIHSHNPPDTFFLIGMLFKLSGKRYVFDHHDISSDLYVARSDDRPSRLVHRVLLGLEALTYRVADRVIATNESIRQVAIERGGVDPGRTCVVRNGPPLAEIKEIAPMPELRVPGKILLGYAGEISVQDGLHYLVDALDHLRRNLGRSDFFCYVIGDGDDLPRIRRLVHQRHLDEHIHFTGWVSYDDVGRYLATIDIGVDPDPSNPFNDRCTMIKMTEYMAFGKPIVAFDLPEHRQTAKGAAIYVPDNDPARFAAAIQTLMDDPERRKRMGAFGRARVENEIAWDYSVPHLIEVYNDLFGLKSTPEPDFDEIASNAHVTER